MADRNDGTLLDYVSPPNVDAGRAAPADETTFAVIIPAYRPETALLDLIGALTAKGVPAIVVVDDGSGPEYRDLFRRTAESPRVQLVRHAVNLGKGAALKTGMNHALVLFPNLRGVVTADADGQHHPDDIVRVAEALAAEPDRLILGTRTFAQDVPLRSRVGNIITRQVMRALVGQNISDTQTGLRGIPAGFLPQVLKIEANGYDYELDMLVAARQRVIGITQVPIRTIYEPGNRTSHFNPLIDSMKIYFVLLRFSSVSLMSAALDSLVFYLAYRRFGNLALSQVLGRVLSVAFNYSMVRRTVFFSKLRNATVLPKYLLLVCVSGTASYAGIRLLTSHGYFKALPAKILVETLLFFANFAIQRDFIFGKASAEELPRDAQASAAVRTFRYKLVSLLLAVAAVGLAALLYHGLRGQDLDPGWTLVGRLRFFHYARVAAIAGAAILIVAPRAIPGIAAVLGIGAMVAAIGPVAVLTVAVFLISACALGSIVMRRDGDESIESQLCATLLGMAIYILVMTLLARLPIHYPLTYSVVLAIPVLVDLRGTGQRLKSWGVALTKARPVSWQSGLALVLLLLVLGMHLLLVPQPESSADGLAMHLAIPVNISLHHAFTYQPGRIFWSVMPMGADWCYSIVYLLGGEFAARLLDFAMLLVVCALLYCAARRWVTPALGYIIVAVFASTSMVQLVTGSLFIENFLAAVVVGSLAALWKFGESGERRWLYVGTALAGTSMAIKFGGLVYVVVMLPVAIIEIRRQWSRLGPDPRRVWAAALILLLLTALPTYIISWRLTGDPLFPFLNPTFPSPLVDKNATFADYRYSQPLTWHTLYDITFHTSSYFEGRPGSLGFAYLLLVPLGLIGLIADRKRVAVGSAAVSVVGALIVLLVLGNVRYLYPSLPLMLVPLAALLGWLPPGPLRQAIVALAVVCVFMNTWFLPSSNFYHGEFHEPDPLSAAAQRAYVHDNCSMREVGDYMNRVHPGAPVFLADGSELAAFKAEVYTDDWHQFNNFARLEEARDAHDVLGIFDQWKVHYVAAPKPEMRIPLKRPILRDVLNKCGTIEFRTIWTNLFRIECDPALAARPEPLPVPPGVYDDYDPAILFEGRWSQNPGFPQTFNHTITYSNLPGSLMRFNFRGHSLTYVYTKAVNRGIAEVTIDGVKTAVLDLYSPQTQWQSKTTFGNLGEGRHVAVITLLTQKNPKAADPFIDLDAFEVQ